MHVARLDGGYDGRKVGKGLVRARYKMPANYRRAVAEWRGVFRKYWIRTVRSARVPPIIPKRSAGQG